MRSKSSLLAHHHDAPRGCDFEKSLSVQHFYCGTFNFFSTAIKAKILKRSQPKISDEDDPLSVGPVVYIIKVLRTFNGTSVEISDYRVFSLFETVPGSRLPGIKLQRLKTAPQSIPDFGVD